MLLGMTPAHQRLGARRPSLRIHLDLVMQLELASADRLAQVGMQARAR